MRIKGLGMRLGFVLGLVSGITIMGLLLTAVLFSYSKKLKTQQIQIMQQSQQIQYMYINFNTVKSARPKHVHVLEINRDKGE